MDTKELLIIADAVSKEKGLSKREVFAALAEGIETALRRDFPEGALLSVNFDEKTGEIHAYRLFELVEQIENVEAQMLNSEVEEEVVVDGFVFEPFEVKMDRQKFNITKQVALQKIKQGSRDHQIEDLLEQPIALFSGTVKVVKKEQLIVDCNGLDITIPRRNLLPRDNYKSGDKVYFTLEKDRNQYIGTRVSDQYLVEVFKREIIQVEEGDIEITAVARNPGFRSKVIVKSLVRNLDPVKMCIGSKGTHIKNIQSFLNNEFVDIIAYNEEPAQLVVHAFEPVNVTNILIDEESKSMDIAVADEEISQAIGKGGKNVELISKLLGWTLNVMSQSEWAKKESFNDEKLIAVFQKGLFCDKEVAELLVQEGFTSLEEVAYVPLNEFEVDLSDETINILRANARETLSNPVSLSKANGAGELVKLGFNEFEIDVLQENSIYGNSEVADLATFELTDILSQLSEEKAQHIIIEARKHDDRFHESSDNSVSA